MNPTRKNPDVTHPDLTHPDLTHPDLIQADLTQADFDRALLADRDALVPSSGFAASVMSALQASAAPAPIPFPFKRAIPGFAAAVLALAFLVVTAVSAVRSLAHAPAGSASLALTLREHFAAASTQATNALWIAVSLATPVLCLLLCRRLISPR